MSQIIAMILRSIAAATSLDLFGEKASRLVPVLNTIAALAELPESLRPQAEALKAQVEAWVAEKRGPTDAELDAFKTQRDDLDAQLRALRADLGGGTL